MPAADPDPDADDLDEDECADEVRRCIDEDDADRDLLERELGEIIDAELVDSLNDHTDATVPGDSPDDAHGQDTGTGDDAPLAPISASAEAYVPCRPSLEQVQVGFGRWADGALSGSCVLWGRNEAMANTLPGANKQMSLLAGVDQEAGAPTLKFVSWVHVPSRRGREVSLDYSQRAMFSVPARVPCLDYSTWLIVHPAIGICMTKEKGRDRPRVPGPILQLKHMWQTALASHTHAPCAGLCCVCNGVEAGPVMECALCQLAWHAACAGCVREHCEKVALPVRRLQWDHLPSEFVADGRLDLQGLVCVNTHVVLKLSSACDLIQLCKQHNHAEVSFDTMHSPASHMMCA